MHSGLNKRWALAYCTTAAVPTDRYPRNPDGRLTIFSNETLTSLGTSLPALENSHNKDSERGRQEKKAKGFDKVSE